ADAASDIRAGLRADAGGEGGTGGGADGPGVDEETVQREWEELIRWAEARGLMPPADFRGPEGFGGAEHDLRFDASAGRWYKYTRPNSAGRTVGKIQSTMESVFCTRIIINPNS